MRDLDPLHGIAADFLHRMAALSIQPAVFGRAAEAVTSRENWCERINPGDATTYVLCLVFEGSNCFFGSSMGPLYPWAEIPLSQDYVTDKWAGGGHRHTGAVFTLFLNNVWRHMEVD